MEWVGRCGQSSETNDLVEKEREKIFTPPTLKPYILIYTITINVNIDGIVQALNRWLSLNIKFIMMMSSVPRTGADMVSERTLRN